MFAATALDPDHEVFVVHIAFLSVNSGNEVYLSRKAQIAHLKADNTPSKVPSEYADSANVFSPKLVVELPEHTGINDHIIELVDNRQYLYDLIYSLNPIEIETLKAYLKYNRANGFIRPFKSPIGVPIFYDKKPDSSMRLCMDYRGLKNLTINNRYLLPLVGKSLD